MDTGCGHDLANILAERGCDVLPVSMPLAFNTANGPVGSGQYVEVDVEELSTSAHPYMMQGTPAVLSIGRRCMEEGCTFVWKPEQDPYLTTPRGAVAVLENDGNIPYLRVGSEQCVHLKPTCDDWYRWGTPDQ